MRLLLLTFLLMYLANCCFIDAETVSVNSINCWQTTRGKQSGVGINLFSIIAFYPLSLY